MKSKRSYIYVCAAVLAALAAGCGSSSNNNMGTNGGGGTGSNPTAAEYLYSSASQAGGNIYAFKIDTATGNLTQVSGSPFAETAGPKQGCQNCYLGLLADPAGGFLFYTSGVGSMKIDASSGALTQVGNYSPNSLYFKADPSGKFLYSNQPGCGCTGGAGSNPVDSIAAWTINSDGSLSTVSGSPFAYSTDSTHISYGDPAVSGSYIFATEYIGGGTSVIHGFQIDPSSGSLAPVSTTPDGQAGALSLITPDGKFLYSEQNYNNNGVYDLQIAGFQVNSDGTLTPISSAPIQTSDQILTNLFISPDGKFLYEMGSSAMRVFSIDPTSGALTQTASDSTLHLDELAFDPSGKYVYGSPSQNSTASNKIQGYSVNTTTGALTAISSATATLPDSPQSIAVVGVP